MNITHASLITLTFSICLLHLSPAFATEWKTTNVVDGYIKTDRDTIEFSLDDEIAISPGESVEFIIPEEFTGRKINFAYIYHRKDPELFDKGLDGLDQSSPWVSVSAFNKGEGKWHQWADQFGAKKRTASREKGKAKKNTLYNFPEFTGDFSASRLRLENSGTGNSGTGNSVTGNPAKSIALLSKVGVTFLATGDRVPSAQKNVFSTYTINNSQSISYILDEKEGKVLKHNHSFEFLIPERFQKSHLLYSVLKHRKDPSYSQNISDPDAYDPNAAYILCELHNKDNKLWYRWADRSSLAKFSEVREKENPEDETLHNGLRTYGLIYPDSFRLTNVGIGDPLKAVSNIHSLELVFLPEQKGIRFMEEIYTPETAFNDLTKGILVPLLGGGPRLGGKFPNAVVLGIRAKDRIKKISLLHKKYQFEVNQNTGANAYLDGKNRLHIKLPAHKTLEQVEIAIGDLDLTSMSYNKDGYFGRSGKAEATIYLENKENRNRKYVLIMRNNVGMAGFISVGSPKAGFRTIENDEVVVQVNFDVAFLMGYRIAYRD